MRLFLARETAQSGIYDVGGNAYFRIAEWLGTIGEELYTQSDVFWSCRIRRYLLQILYLLDDLGAARSEKSSVERVLDFLHTEYQRELSLDMICRLFCTNRTTLNRNFKARTGSTVMQYLAKHRIEISKEMLLRTNLSIAEIANACGYRYDTYFISQFTKETGMSPTEYRHCGRR